MEYEPPRMMTRQTRHGRTSCDRDEPETQRRDDARDKTKKTTRARDATRPSDADADADAVTTVRAKK